MIPRPTASPTMAEMAAAGQSILPPHRDTVPGWARPGQSAAWVPTWVLPGDGGLAVRVTSTALFVLHEASGLAVVSANASGDPIKLSALRRVRAALKGLLNLRPPVGNKAPTCEDGRIDWPAVTYESVSTWLQEATAAIVREHLPGKPAYRAHRADADGSGYESRWFASCDAAAKWAEDKAWRGSERWWAIERWSSKPPAGPLRADRPDLRALTEGRFSSPLLHMFAWSAFGRRYSVAASEQPTRERPGPVTDADVDRLGDAVSNERLPYAQAPTGEVDLPTERMLAAGLLAWAERNLWGDGPVQVLEPTLRGLLALSRRAIRSAHPRAWNTTTAALETWRKAKRAHREALRSVVPARFASAESIAWEERDAQHRRATTRQARLVAWLHLLACIARDRREPKPRFELRRDHDAGSLEVREHVYGVAVLKVTRHARWYFMAFRTCPIVSWALGCALTDARLPPDAEGWCEPTLREYEYRENAEQYAAELRAGKVGTS